MMRNSLVIGLLLVVNSCTAQINMIYSIGCIGNTNTQTRVTSSAVVIDGNSCFVMSSGIKTFAGGKAGIFTSNCEKITAGTNTGSGYARKITLRAFPNPVISIVTIQSIERLQTADKLQAVVYTINGQRLRTINADTKQLNMGLKVDMRGLLKGIYILKVFSAAVTTEFKLIKID